MAAIPQHIVQADRKQKRMAAIKTMRKMPWTGNYKQGAAGFTFDWPSE